jgi:hypothetical protein
MKMNFNFIDIQPRLPDGLRPLPADPLADAPLPCLSLLAGYLVGRYRAAGAPRTPWLDRALAPGRPACRTLPWLMAAARGSAAVRRELDRWFDRDLGVRAAPLEPCTAFELAALWARERERLAGAELAALLWVLARRNDLPARRLADRIGAAVDRRRLAGTTGA